MKDCMLERLMLWESYKNRECIIDFKQSNNPKKKSQCEDYFNQAAAYAMAHNDMYGTKIQSGMILVSVMGGEIQEFWLKPDEFKARCHIWLKKVSDYWENHVPRASPRNQRSPRGGVRMSALRRPIVYFKIFFKKIKIKKINIPSQCLNGLKLLVLLAKVLPQTCLNGVSRCLKTLRARNFLRFVKT